MAVSDDLKLIASPVESVDLKRGGIDALQAVIARYDPESIIVGLPTGMSGREGPQATAVRRFITELKPLIERRFIFWDERLTTAMAERALQQTGHRSRQRRARVDAVAASLILQSYLDSLR